MCNAQEFAEISASGQVGGSKHHIWWLRLCIKGDNELKNENEN